MYGNQSYIGKPPNHTQEVDMTLQLQVAGKAMSSGLGWVNILVYGMTGSGKSWLIGTSKKPLVILTEANGMASIAHSNPNAIIATANTMEDIDNILRGVKDGSIKKKHDFDVLAIDSLTEMQRMIKNRILKKAKRDKMQLQDWGTLADEMIRYIRAIRDLPCHVVCTALLDQFIEDQSGTMHTQPSFEGKKTTAVISQFFNAVGFLYKEQQDNDVAQRKLMFDGPQRVLCKPCHPVYGVIQDPNMQDIINKLTKVEK